MSAAAHRVVVADDSAFMRRLVSAALEQALACWERLQPDAMTLDLAMPGRDAIGVLPATRKLVIVASSTGGPRALATVVPQLPATVGSGVLLVQHMPPGFTASLAARLDAEAQLTVREAAAGEPVGRGTALLAPGGSHLRLGPDRRAILSDEEAIGGLRPRADLTVEDATALYGDRVVLVVLTGMGNDGLAGARAVKSRGGRVLVQDEATSTVYGMPRAIAEAGLADRILPLEQLPAAIVEEAGA